MGIRFFSVPEAPKGAKMEEKINSGVTRTGETDIRLNLIDSFPNHPYHVFDDEDMTELTASIEAICPVQKDFYPK